MKYGFAIVRGLPAAEGVCAKFANLLGAFVPSKDSVCVHLCERSSDLFEIV